MNKRFTELLRDVGQTLEDHNNDTVSSLLYTAADTIDNNNIYKIKWAELGEKYAQLEKENETLLAELKTLRNIKDEL
jgi:hypothetical protein